MLNSPVAVPPPRVIRGAMVFCDVDIASRPVVELTAVASPTRTDSPAALATLGVFRIAAVQGSAARFAFISREAKAAVTANEISIFSRHRIDVRGATDQAHRRHLGDITNPDTICAVAREELLGDIQIDCCHKIELSLAQLTSRSDMV